MSLVTIRKCMSLSSSGKLLLVVIHCTSQNNPLGMAQVALDNGADGVLLISHGDLSSETLLELASDLRVQTSSREVRPLIGVNLLGTALVAIPQMLDKNVAARGSLDLLWVDKQPDAGANRILDGLHGYLTRYDVALAAGCAFKYQAPIPNEELAAHSVECQKWMDILTTSGSKTGVPAAPTRLRLVTKGDRLLALASGVTTFNARMYDEVDLFFVASSLELEHGVLDVPKIAPLAEAIHRHEA